MTLFRANYNYHLVMQFKALTQPSSLISEIQADTFAAGLEEIHQTLHKNLKEAQANPTKSASGKEVVSVVGYKVSLSTKHFQTTRPSTKLDS
jgi:hypothetical protein